MFPAQVRRSRPTSAILALGVVLVLALVYFSLSRTPIQIPGDTGGRLTHLTTYAFMTFWFARACGTLRHTLVVAAGLFVLGVVIEYMQGAVGYRSLERADMLANGLGIACGVLLALPFMLGRRPTAV